MIFKEVSNNQHNSGEIGASQTIASELPISIQHWNLIVPRERQKSMCLFYLVATRGVTSTEGLFRI